MDLDLLKAIGEFINTVGVPVTLLAMVGYALRVVILWARPRAEIAVEKHFKLVDNLCSRSEVDDTQHHRVIRVMGHIGDAVEAATPDERKPHVKPHIEQVRNEVRSDK